MEPSLFRYIWQNSKAEQFSILLIVAFSLPFYFLALDLPKQIINEGIQGESFEGPGSTDVFGAVSLPFAEEIFGEKIILFDGFMLEQQGMLLALSFSFLAMVCINGLFKFRINTAKGRLGERMLRRLRYELTDRLLRFPLPQVRKIKPAEAATMVNNEVEPLGGFIGDAFVTPAFGLGQALTALAFILIQSFWLGLIAILVLVFQAYLIPKLRVPILRLGRQRQLTARQLSGRVSELISGTVEIHSNDASNWERAEISSRLGKIFHIRFEIFERKFFVKFLNNFLSQVTPFLFYAGGGLLALRGNLDIGALVAVIAAYKDLPGPVKELLTWEQQRQDVQIKYEQVIEQFQLSEIAPKERFDPDAEVKPFEGAVSFAGVLLQDETKTRLLDSVRTEFDLKSHVAVVGKGASGKDHLSYVLAGLLMPNGGFVSIGGRKVSDQPEPVLGRRFGYVEPSAFHFPLSVGENLLYGLKHKPLRAADYSEAEGAAKQDEIQESLRAANPTFDIDADWVDYEAAGARSAEDLKERMIEVLDLVGLSEDVYRFGLQGSIDPHKQPNLSKGILAARSALAERLAKEGQEDLVERFAPDTFNKSASLAENLLFGTPVDPAYEADALADNPLVLEILEEIGILDRFTEKGFEIAKTMVEIFADLPPGHPFFEQFSFIDADDLPDYRALVARAEQKDLASLDPKDQRKFNRLPFKYVEARHRLSLIDDDFRARILDSREKLAERIEKQAPGAVAFYDPEAYNAAASLIDNILFGRVAYGRAEADKVIGEAIHGLLQESGLRQPVIEVGLEHNVGVGGKRLSSTQSQKLAFARALIKRPDLLIVNEATAVMDGTSRASIFHKVLAHRRDQGVFWVLERASMAEQFDLVLVMENGRLVESGSFEELKEKGGAFAALLEED